MSRTFLTVKIFCSSSGVKVLRIKAGHYKSTQFSPFHRVDTEAVRRETFFNNKISAYLITVGCHYGVC